MSIMAKQLNLEQYRRMEEEMHQNLHESLSLLMNKFKPSPDLQFHFKLGMFAKSNSGAFLHVMHFLLNIIDPAGFRNNFQWPCYDRNMESDFKTKLRDFLSELDKKYPEAGLGPIKISYMVTPGGYQFTDFITNLCDLAMLIHLRSTGKNPIIPTGDPESNKAYYLKEIEKADLRIKARKSADDKLEKLNIEEVQLIQKRIEYVDEWTAKVRGTWKKHVFSIPNLTPEERNLLISNPGSVLSNLKALLSVKFDRVEKLFNSLSKKASICEELHKMCNIILNHHERGHCLEYNNTLTDLMPLRKYIAVEDIPLIDKIVENGTLNLPIFLHCLKSVFDQMKPIVSTENAGAALYCINESLKALDQILVQCKDLDSEILQLKNDFQKSIDEAREDFEKELKDDEPPISLASYWPDASPCRNLKWFASNSDESLSTLKEARTHSMVDLNRTSIKGFKPDWFKSTVMTGRKMKKSNLEKSSQRYKSTPCLSSPACKQNLTLAMDLTNPNTMQYSKDSSFEPGLPKSQLSMLPDLISPRPNKIPEVRILNESTTYKPVSMKKNQVDKFVTPQKTTRRSVIEANIGKRLSCVADEMPIPKLGSYDDLKPCSIHTSPMGYKSPNVPIAKLVKLDDTEDSEKLDICSNLPTGPTKSNDAKSHRFSLSRLLDNNYTEDLLSISDIDFNVSLDSD